MPFFDRNHGLTPLENMKKMRLPEVKIFIA